jgi:O-antigen ligase
MGAMRSITVDGLLTGRAAQTAAAVIAGGAGALLVTHGGTQAVALAAVALAAVIAGWRWPALPVLATLMLCQELDPSQGFGGAGGSGLLFLGHQLYFKTFARFSLLTLMLVAVAARASLSLGRTPVRKAALWLALALGGYYVARVWAGGSAITSAINQNARFAILFGATFVIGIEANAGDYWKRLAVPVFRLLIVALVLVGGFLEATGRGIPGQPIFYDSAMGAIAGAGLLAVIFIGSAPDAATAQARRGMWLLAVAALGVVILSARRDDWAGMAVAALLALALTQDRLRLVVRLLGGAAVALVVLAIFAPATLTSIGHQISAIWQATQGTAADASAKGHLSDISVGWAAVNAHPISGLGPNGQLVGLVVQSTGQLYIHNQILESWLRFGIVGAALVIALQLLLAGQALTVLRRRDARFHVRWAAYLLLIAPTAMLTAPFLTQTQRWPAVLGLAAGLVAAELGSGSAPQAA